MNRSAIARIGVFLCVPWVALTGFACEVGLVPGTALFFDGNRFFDLVGATLEWGGEPNDGFENAIDVQFDASGHALLSGMIEVRGDEDVFCLGPLRAGDRVIVDVDTVRTGTGLTDGLDSMIALFDGDFNLFIDNDDSETSIDSFIDEIVRHDSDAYYLAVGGPPYRKGTGTTGSYSVNIDVSSGHPVPPPRPQVVFLDFDGGVVDTNIFGVNIVPPFDAGAFDPQYEDETEAIKTRIVETVSEAFAGFAITTMTSDDTEAPAEPFSTVFFGAPRPQGFAGSAAAEHTDYFNADPSDVAIVFLTPLSDTSVPLPTAERFGQSLGRSAAHEVGHLLGLVHVIDRRSLMDAFHDGEPDLEEQRFKRAPLYSPELFRVGFQDPVLLLSETLGTRDSSVPRVIARERAVDP